MSQAERLLRDYLDTGDRRDFEALAGVLDPDVVTHSPGGLTTRGLEAQIVAWTAAHEGLDRLTHEVQDVVGVDDAAAARVRVQGVHSGPFLGVDPTGHRIDVAQALFVRVARSRIVEIWEVVDTASGLMQIGVLDDRVLSPGGDPTGTQ